MLVFARHSLRCFHGLTSSQSLKETAFTEVRGEENYAGQRLGLLGVGQGWGEGGHLATMFTVKWEKQRAGEMALWMMAHALQ